MPLKAPEAKFNRSPNNPKVRLFGAAELDPEVQAAKARYLLDLKEDLYHARITAGLLPEPSWEPSRSMRDFEPLDLAALEREAEMYFDTNAA